MPGFRRSPGLTTTKRILAVRACGSTTVPIRATCALKWSSGYAAVVTSASAGGDAVDVALEDVRLTQTVDRSVTVMSGVPVPTNWPLRSSARRSRQPPGSPCDGTDAVPPSASSSNPSTRSTSSLWATLARALAKSFSDCCSEMREAAW
jgi:hypothetical protein